MYLSIQKEKKSKAFKLDDSSVIRDYEKIRLTLHLLSMDASELAQQIIF